MNRLIQLNALFISLLFCVQLNASEFYSHTVVNLPNDYRSESPWLRYISTQEQWEAFYEELISHQRKTLLDVEPIPEIDFENFMLVTGGLGFRASSGTSLLVENVIELGSVVYINAASITAGPSCMTFAMVTYPTVAILIRKTDKEIRTYLTQAIHHCN